ncbi:MAG: bifunctional nicotinamidase/pyrazinamidase [Verrucomicrobia bacterium]|nr:bifunctional nicotinamidase/pyrazinamidase [Verrucomicrobiota bacterium]
MNALLIVDVQNDFLPGGALPVPEGDRVAPLINRLIPRFEAVYATQDWHPADHLSFAANHPGRRPGETVEIGGLEQILWPVHCVQFTGGACFAPGLRTAPIRRVFPKGADRETDSYSGFFDNGRRRATGLADCLREAGVEELTVCGLALDYCVKFTVLDALELGFRVRLVQDACRAVNLRAGDGDRALEAMRAAGARIVAARELAEPS